MELRTIAPIWRNEPCIVAATGPSLTVEVVDYIRQRKEGKHCIAINTAYQRMIYADILWACDARWWEAYHGARDFAGERWSSHHVTGDDKARIAARYNVNLVAGYRSETFSLKPDVIHYGRNGGFQAVNLAILLGAKPIVLVGFDMRKVDGKRHFFGDYKSGLANGELYQEWVRIFTNAAKRLPAEIEIINATPGSALTCFPMKRLEDVIA